MQVFPLHAPPKPENWKPVAGVALSARVVPVWKLAVQEPGQLIPAGLLLTVPLPVVATVICACWEEVVELPPPPHAVSARRETKINNQENRQYTCFIQYYSLILVAGQSSRVAPLRARGMAGNRRPLREWPCSPMYKRQGDFSLMEKWLSSC